MLNVRRYASQKPSEFANDDRFHAVRERASVGDDSPVQARGRSARARGRARSSAPSGIAWASGSKRSRSPSAAPSSAASGRPKYSSRSMTRASSTPSAMSAATLSSERSLDETSAFRRSIESSMSIVLETDSMSFSIGALAHLDRELHLSSTRDLGGLGARPRARRRTVRSANRFISSMVTARSSFSSSRSRSRRR